jgi:hypothetical protein
MDLNADTALLVMDLKERDPGVIPIFDAGVFRNLTGMRDAVPEALGSALRAS